MHQEIMVGLGLMVLIYFFVSTYNSGQQVQADEPNYLMDKYGLTENEYRIFTYIADPIKREQYLDYVIRSKQK